MATVVEREMFDGGLFKEAVGIDYSKYLLDDARAATGDRPLTTCKQISTMILFLLGHSIWS